MGVYAHPRHRWFYDKLTLYTSIILCSYVSIKPFCYKWTSSWNGSELNNSYTFRFVQWVRSCKTEWQSVNALDFICVTYIHTNRQTKQQTLEVKTRPLPLLGQLIKYRTNNIVEEDFWITFTTDAASKTFPWEMWAIHAMVGPNVNTIINLFNLLNFSTFWFLRMLKAFNMFALHYVSWEKVSISEHICNKAMYRKVSLLWNLSHFIFLIFASRIIVRVYNTVLMILCNHPDKVSKNSK